MELKSAKTKADLESIYPIIKELRTNLTLQDFLHLTTEASKRDDYEIVAYFENNTCLGAMGYRTLYDLVHGKHLYIDDLVVTANSRSKGIGAKLLKYAEEIAAAKQCKGLRLCTGVDNQAGKRFYEREGWKQRSVAYKKPLA